MTQILQPTPSNLDQFATALAEGEIVAVPTETVYGLAGNALDKRAVSKIYLAKGRPARNPLIAHVSGIDQLATIAEISEVASSLMEYFWPGPLTLILPKKAIVPDIVTADLDTVAVRMPSHPVYQELAKCCPFPLAAPSANPFGYVSPTRAEHVLRQMEGKIDWILDGGPCDKGIESTIVSLADPSKPTVLRRGSISPHQLEAAIGKPVITPDTIDADQGQNLPSPGLMKRHYSPNTKVCLFEGSPSVESKSSAVVFLSKVSCSASNHYYLSQNGDLEEVAKQLYNLLQELDQKAFHTIYLELPEAQGTGAAIRDRMERAAAR